MGRANKQVSLEARVLEVRLNDEYSLGVNWSLLPGLFNSNKTGLAAGGGVVSQTAASGGTALSFGILDGGDFSLVVDALQSQGQVRVLSSPRVSTLNNQLANIAVTDQVPFIRREIVTQEGIARTEFSVEFVQTGVLLSVRPLIGEDGLLSVSITPSVREQIGTVVTPDGFVTVPILSERLATTTVRVADGQAIALGGLRSTRKSESRQGIPFLMDIPWLGQAFSNTVQERDEVELMIVLVPRVLDDTWISEEVQRGAHRLVQLRSGFQWNPIRLDGYRPEDWSGGSLQGEAQAAVGPAVRLPDPLPAPLPPEQGTTVTRSGLANHLLVRADQELAKGDPQAALALLERALLLDPHRLEALVGAGVLHDRRGERARARVLLDRAVDQGNDDVVALSARGALELGAGSPFAAKRYFEAAHDKSKTTMTAANLGAAMLVLGEVEAARELLRSVADPSAPPELHANLAFAELQTGHADLARESLRRALAAGADARNPRLVALQRLVAN
ncbi:MAG: tetratricopeptide repeat protein [Planctomycetes bacterium]|nr:tetratricopeptide repeat protein [Planctomycetota bacterium]